MISILQRVKQARVEIDGQVAGSIGPGLLALVCAERGDTEAEADSVLDLEGLGACGGLLIVSQFTLAADTGGGNRPSFTRAAPPADGERLYDYIVQRARALHPDVATGRFGADMQVHLLNDGPVTIPLSIAPAAAA
jgi:D-tyrosyl-tRNA(Tyr) deacylase